MKIGIDISQVVYGTGVSSYTRNLVESLLRIDKANEYVLFFSSLRRKFSIFNFQFSNKLLTPNSQLKPFKLPPTLLDILWNRLHVLPVEKLIDQVDVFHTSDWTEPPAKCPKVTTIHDLTPLLFPEETYPKIVAVHKRKLEWVKKESKLIIAVSESTKKDIIEHLGIPEERIRVVYEAVNEEFGVRSQEFGVDKIKKKYGIKGDYLLAFAGPARKNLKRLIRAHNVLLSQYPNIELVIIGSPSLVPPSEEPLRVTIGGGTRCPKYLGYVAQEDLRALYSGALCLVYPSLYEGFGLPILEAMACGCPVVTSNISSMPEVAGKAAVLVDPLNIDDIARGIKEALGRREEMVKKGYERVKDFSWEKCARETLEVYKEVVGL